MQVSRLISLLLIYALMLLAAFLLQRKMMYFPARFGSAQYLQLLQGLQLRPWPSADDMRAVISDNPLPSAKGTVIVFHGNAGSAVHRSYYFEALQRLGYRTVVAEYPGYGIRKGEPAEAELIRDAILTTRRLYEEFKGPVFLCGESLGSGVVSGIVASKTVPIHGLLLITPFDTMANVAQHHYWFLFAKWLIRDKFDNIRNLRGFTGKTAVILAERDDIIPNKSTMALFDSLPGDKKLWRFGQANHNSLPLAHWNSWWREAMQFIDR